MKEYEIKKYNRKLQEELVTPTTPPPTLKVSLWDDHSATCLTKRVMILIHDPLFPRSLKSYHEAHLAL